MSDNSLIPEVPEENLSEASPTKDSGISTHNPTLPAMTAELKKWFMGIGCALGLILLGGVAHGVLSNRWGVSENIQALGSQLNSIPMEIGPWKCSEEGKLEDRVIYGILEASGYISRVYVHQSTDEAINVFLVFGPKGPVAVHTPEIC
jgi:hypothetical protein